MKQELQKKLWMTTYCKSETEKNMDLTLMKKSTAKLDNFVHL